MSRAWGKATLRFRVAAIAWLISTSDDRRRISFVAPRGSLASLAARLVRRGVPTISSVGGIGYDRIVAGYRGSSTGLAGAITDHLCSAGDRRSIGSIGSEQVNRVNRVDQVRTRWPA